MRNHKTGDALHERAHSFLRDRPHAKSIAHLRMADALVSDLAERLAEVEAERDRLSSECNRLLAERGGEVWLWNGDGFDDPESLSCPVLMTADQVRAMAGEMERLRRLCLDAANYLDDLGTASGDTMAARLRAAGGER